MAARKEKMIRDIWTVCSGSFATASLGTGLRGWEGQSQLVLSPQMSTPIFMGQP